MHSRLHKHEGLINCRSAGPLHLYGARPAKDLLALLQECLLLYFSFLVPLCRVRWAGQVSTSWLVGQGGAPAAVPRKAWGAPPPKGVRGGLCAGSREATQCSPGQSYWYCCRHTGRR